MRLQILELPMHVVGELTETPFVIVVSEAGSLGPQVSDEVKAHLQMLKEQTGAAHVLVTNEVVEIGPAA